MLRKSQVFKVFGAVSIFWLVPAASVSAAHFLGHGVVAQPSAQQIDKFCKQYPALIKSPNFNQQDNPKYEKLYKQHCDQPSAKPSKPKSIQPAKPETPGEQPPIRQGRIDRIQPPACLDRGSEIRVRGKNLRDGGLDCRLEGGGQRQLLQAYSRTAGEFRYRLSHLQPGPDYVLQCDVDGDRQRISLKGCAEPGTPAQASDVDLAAEIRAGMLRPGETQMVEVLISNRGRSRTLQNRRYRVRLALVDRDLTRSVGMAMGGRGTLVEKEQWAMRVPAAGQSERLSVAMNVPGRLSGTESLYWCAVADSDQQIPEANKRNNLACVPASRGQQTAERDGLSKLFGSAVRNRRAGGQIPDEARVGEEQDPSSEPRTMMYEGDAGQPGLASVQVELEEQPALPRGAPELPAVGSGAADLAVTGFRIKRWGSCEPDAYTMVTFEVTVENVGSASAEAPTVSAVDVHEGHNWGNGTVLEGGVLFPGESRTASIDVGRVGEPTGHMVDDAPHPLWFRADML